VPLTSVQPLLVLVLRMLTLQLQREVVRKVVDEAPTLASWRGFSS
jgi:hypothetical protein